MGDFRSALQNERETYAIYKQQLGENHEKTKESSDCLRHLTQQAVVLQKRMNEICSIGTTTTTATTNSNLNNGAVAAAGLPPIQIQPPSMGSVLDMLNVINGILFVQISQQDIEHLKAEIEKRQQQQSAATSSDAKLTPLTEDLNEEKMKTEETSNNNNATNSPAVVVPAIAS